MFDEGERCMKLLAIKYTVEFNRYLNKLSVFYCHKGDQELCLLFVIRFLEGLGKISMHGNPKYQN